MNEKTFYSKIGSPVMGDLLLFFSRSSVESLARKSFLALASLSFLRSFFSAFSLFVPVFVFINLPSMKFTKLPPGLSGTRQQARICSRVSPIQLNYHPDFAVETVTFNLYFFRGVGLDYLQFCY